jgi:uncharacterized protein (TIGR02270 family)
VTAPVGYIPDILEEHLEELQFLLARRPVLIRSPIAHLRDLADLDERILAHLDGVLAVGEPAVTPLTALLSSDDPAAIHAATFALAHLPGSAAGDVLAATFAKASAEALIAVAGALRLCQGPIVVQLADTRLQDADPLARVLSAGLVSRSRGAAPRDAWLAEFLRDANPLVRQHAWRLAGETGVTLDAKAYAAAVRDEDAGVRREGMIAAARCSVAGILTIARKAAEKPAKEHADELRLLAALGKKEDEKRLRYVVTDASLGALRFELAGLYGAPVFADLLIEAMRSEEPRLAIAAGAAFTRMTGIDVESTERATLPPEDETTPDEFEAEFLDEAQLPDPAKAQAHWSRAGPSLQDATRICGGHDASAALSAAQWCTLDLESFSWQATRHRFFRWAVPSALADADFPSPREAEA